MVFPHLLPLPLKRSNEKPEKLLQINQSSKLLRKLTFMLLCFLFKRNLWLWFFWFSTLLYLNKSSSYVRFCVEFLNFHSTKHTLFAVLVRWLATRRRWTLNEFSSETKTQSIIYPPKKDCQCKYLSLAKSLIVLSWIFPFLNVALSLLLCVCWLLASYIILLLIFWLNIGCN